MEENSDKVTGISEKKIFQYNGKVMDLTRPRVMGILNVTPDSFYKDGIIGQLDSWTVGHIIFLIALSPCIFPGNASCG
jgi:hypothetical protein